MSPKIKLDCWNFDSWSLSRCQVVFRINKAGLYKAIGTTPTSTLSKMCGEYWKNQHCISKSGNLCEINRFRLEDWSVIKKELCKYVIKVEPAEGLKNISGIVCVYIYNLLFMEHSDCMYNNKFKTVHPNFVIRNYIVLYCIIILLWNKWQLKQEPKNDPEIMPIMNSCKLFSRTYYSKIGTGIMMFLWKIRRYCLKEQRKWTCSVH